MIKYIQGRHKNKPNGTRKDKKECLGDSGRQNSVSS